MLARKQLCRSTLIDKPLISRCCKVLNISHRTCWYSQYEQPSRKQRINGIFTQGGKAKWFIAVGGVGLAIYVGSHVYIQYQIDKAPQRAFEHSHVPAVTTKYTAPFIPRDKEVSNLSEFIQESTVRGKYVVMLGEHGCGKTTLIEQTCQCDALRQRGCVYISIPEADKGKVKVTETLAAPFTYTKRGGFLASVVAVFTGYTPKVTTTAGPAPFPTDLTGVLSIIERGAIDYASHKDQLPPILVIDNINHLATADPLALETLQNRAKEWADRRIVTVVFVSSDGAAPQLKGRSAYSRAAEYLVRGIPESVAVDYLHVNKKLTIEMAEKVVRKLTGDRLHLIVDIASIKAANSYEEIQEIVFAKMKSHVVQLLNEPQQDTATRVITAILNSPSKRIPFDEFRQIVKKSVPANEITGVIHTLRKSEVFFINDNFVTFQSVGMQTYLERYPPTLPK